MARLYLLFFLLQIVLAVMALISCLSAEEGQIRALPRIVWVLIILFFPLLGSLAWFFAGRVTETGQPRTSARPIGGSRQQRSQPVAPDDNPEFLRSLDERFKPERFTSQDREEFRQREENRRQGEAEPPREGRQPEA